MYVCQFDILVMVVGKPLGRLIDRLDRVGGLESKVLGSVFPVPVTGY